MAFHIHPNLPYHTIPPSAAATTKQAHALPPDPNQRLGRAKPAAGPARPASKLVSGHLDKDEKSFMGIVEPQRAMSFAGSGAPLAYLALKALELPAEKTRQLSNALCDLVYGQLAIPQDRIYLSFHNVNRGMWGWNGDVF